MEVIFDTVSYVKNDNVLCLEDVDITLLSQRIYGVIGNEHSGKDEFVKLLAGVFQQTTGEIHYDNVVIKPYSNKKLCASIKSKIGYVPDDTEYQFTKKTVYEELKNSIKKYHYRETELEKRIFDALKLVGLPCKYSNRNPNTLSLGEQKLLSLSLALVHNPNLLILVEPTQGLDNHKQDRLLMLLRKLKTRCHKTIVILSNDLEFMVKIIDDCILFDHQHLVVCNNKYRVLSDTRKLKKIGIQSPNIILFSDVVLKKKNIKMGYRDQMNDLIKDIYRYAQWGRDKYGRK